MPKQRMVSIYPSSVYHCEVRLEQFPATETYNVMPVYALELLKPQRHIRKSDDRACWSTLAFPTLLSLGMRSDRAVYDHYKSASVFGVTYRDTIPGLNGDLAETGFQTNEISCIVREMTFNIFLINGQPLLSLRLLK